MTRVNASQGIDYFLDRGGLAVNVPITVRLRIPEITHPENIRLSRDERFLCYGPARWRRERDPDLRPPSPADVVREFVKLSVADAREQPMRVREFAQRFGVLDICRHGRAGLPGCADCWKPFDRSLEIALRALQGSKSFPTPSALARARYQIAAAYRCRVFGPASLAEPALKGALAHVPGWAVSMKDLPPGKEPIASWVAAAKQVQAILRLEAARRDRKQSVHLMSNEETTALNGIGAKPGLHDEGVLKQAVAALLHSSRRDRSPDGFDASDPSQLVRLSIAGMLHDAQPDTAPWEATDDLRFEWGLLDDRPSLEIRRYGLRGLIALQLAAVVSSESGVYLCRNPSCPSRVFFFEATDDGQRRPQYCDDDCKAKARRARSRAAYGKNNPVAIRRRKVGSAASSST